MRQLITLLKLTINEDKTDNRELPEERWWVRLPVLAKSPRISATIEQNFRSSRSCHGGRRPLHSESPKSPAPTAIAATEMSFIELIVRHHRNGADQLVRLEPRLVQAADRVIVD